MPDCEHNYQYLGMQWWNDNEPRPGSGATTIRYVHTFFCTRCCETITQATDYHHGSYEKRHPDSTPVSMADSRRLRRPG
jgi:hypothetical protein